MNNAPCVMLALILAIFAGCSGKDPTDFISFDSENDSGASDADADVDSDADSDTDADSDIDSDTYTDSDVDVDSDSDSDSDSDIDSDADADSDADTDSDTDSDADSDSDSDTDTDTDSDGDSDTDSDTDTSTCDHELGSFFGELQNATAEKMSGEIFVVADDSHQIGQGTWNVMELELFGANNQHYDLSDDDQLETAEACIVFGQNCKGADVFDCATYFLSTEGRLDILWIDFDEPWKDDLEFEATDVVLEEVTIDWDDYHSTFVHNGDVVCLDSWSFWSSVEQI